MTENIERTYPTTIEGSDIAFKDYIARTHGAQELVASVSDMHMLMALWISGRMQSSISDEDNLIVKFSSQMDAITAKSQPTLEGVMNLIQSFARAREIGVKHVVVTSGNEVLCSETMQSVMPEKTQGTSSDG